VPIEPFIGFSEFTNKLCIISITSSSSKGSNLPAILSCCISFPTESLILKTPSPPGIFLSFIFIAFLPKNLYFSILLTEFLIYKDKASAGSS